MQTTSYKSQSERTELAWKGKMVGHELREMRLSAGLTLRAFWLKQVDMCGWDIARINEVERGLCDTSPTTMGVAVVLYQRICGAAPQKRGAND